MLWEERHQGHVRGPHDIPTLRNLHVAHVALLLHVEEGDGVRVTEEQHASPGIEDLVAIGDGQLLGHLEIIQLLSFIKSRSLLISGKKHLFIWCFFQSATQVFQNTINGQKTI